MSQGNGRLADKVAIVTGAGDRGRLTGIGYATAILFAREGAKVLLADMDIAHAEKTLAVIQEEGGKASVFQADVTVETQCQAMVNAAVERYGALHILVNNVGTGGSGKVTQVEEVEWHRSLDINLMSAVLTSKYAVPAMTEAGSGSIIHVSSIDGMRAGNSPNIPYGAAKGGLIAITRQMAVHHGREGIRVNCLAPGHVNASFVTHVSEEARDLRRRAGPLGTEGTAWDVAWPAVFLASDEARWVSGVVLNVDAGLFAATPLSMLGHLR